MLCQPKKRENKILELCVKDLIQHPPSRSIEKSEPLHIAKHNIGSWPPPRLKQLHSPKTSTSMLPISRITFRDAPLCIGSANEQPVPTSSQDHDRYDVQHPHQARKRWECSPKMLLLWISVACGGLYTLWITLPWLVTHRCEGKIILRSIEQS